MYLIHQKRNLPKDLFFLTFIFFMPSQALLSQPIDPQTEKKTKKTMQPEQLSAAQFSKIHPKEIRDALGYGSISMCESLASPIGLIPAVGTVITMLAEWVCIIPAAQSINYIELFHGKRPESTYSAMLGIGLGKLWRDLSRIPSIIAAVIVNIVFFTALGGTFFLSQKDLGDNFPVEYIPIAATGFIVASGLSYLLFRKVRKWGQKAIFEGTYNLLTPETSDQIKIKEDQRNATFQPELTGFERLWLLATLSRKLESEHTNRLKYIPLYGRFHVASKNSEALEDGMRYLSNEVLHEDRDELSLKSTFTTIHLINNIAATIEAGADLALFTGAGIFVGGSLLAANQYNQDQRFSGYAATMTVAGTAGLLIASAGLLGIFTAEVVNSSKIIFVPLAYGVSPVHSHWFSKFKTTEEDIGEE